MRAQQRRLTQMIITVSNCTTTKILITVEYIPVLQLARSKFISFIKTVSENRNTPYFYSPKLTDDHIR